MFQSFLLNRLCHLPQAIQFNVLIASVLGFMAVAIF